VFNVDADNGLSTSEETASQPPDLSRRNSRQYSDAAADQLLGLSGRSLTSAFHADDVELEVFNDTTGSLTASVEEVQSDGDDYSVDESGAETTEGECTVESSGRSSPGAQIIVSPSPDTPVPKTKASNTAATRGLNIDVSERGNRHSRIVGLPSSPRPSANQSHSPVSPLHTAR
jgi:RalA-binding protein 1